MKAIQRRIAKYLLSYGLAIGLAIPVYSQDSDSDANNQLLELEMMTVTAEKREEKVQEVPMSISAYSETALEDAGVEEVRDVTLMVPNLDLMSYTGASNRANFRGMNSNYFTKKLPLVMYIDNVPFDEGTAFVGDFNNVERVEVLRGANGTLYGQNAMAGIINIMSKIPGNEPEGKATIKLGQYETYGGNAYYNGPLIQDRLFFGLSGSYDETGGYVENDYPDENTSGGKKATRAKGRLRWKASSSLTADISLSTYQGRSKGGVGNLVAGSEWSDHEYRDPDDVNNLDITQIALDLTYEAGAFDVKSITTHRTADKENVSNFQFIDPNLKRTSVIYETEVITQEFRILSEENSESKWLAGLFFMSEKIDRSENGMEYSINRLAGYGISANYNYFNYPADERATSSSLFGQMTFPLADNMELTAGARYEVTERTLDYVGETLDTYGSSGTSFDGSELLPTASYSATSQWSAFLPRAVLSYRINPEDMVYFSYSQGYQPGSFNRTEANKDKADFDAQYSTTYELGTKTTWIDNRLTFNATVFHTDITDIQVYEWTASNEFYASNAGKARSQGVEIEFGAVPLTGLEFAAAIGFLDSKFIEYEGYDDKKPADAPDFTAYFSGKYRHDSGIYLRGNIQGVGDAYGDDANTVKKESYWIANTRIGYEWSNWDIYLDVENLTNTKYLEHVLASESMVFSTVGKPRTVSVIASARF